jgi:hypothetical protein
MMVHLLFSLSEYLRFKYCSGFVGGTHVKYLLIDEEVGPIGALIHAKSSFEFNFVFQSSLAYGFLEVADNVMRSFEMARATHAYGDHSHTYELLSSPANGFPDTFGYPRPVRKTSRSESQRRNRGIKPARRSGL